MASRIAVHALRASARPQVVSTLPQLARVMSTNPPPAERATEILSKLPSSPSLITKGGTAILGAGAIATAISQELYVVTEETVLLAGSAILFTYIAKAMKEPYKEWAEAGIQRIRGVLNKSREEHTQAVKDRIDSVSQLKDVTTLTKGLFALSKETATLESEAFVQKQKVALAAELKSVLDSWVRYEQQVRESEQADLTKTIIDKVLATINDEKTQKEILTGAVAEIELLVKNKAI